MNTWILIAGLVRSCIWAGGAIFFLRHRRVLQGTGCSLAALTAVVFAINNSGGYVDPGLMRFAAVLATPIAALIVGGGILGVMLRPSAREITKKGRWLW